ncbi:hypothetical protein AMJ85_10750 [candidate division BRC1 bacterium SM23_51]|nr:MAG: hypothetical protein AMJ85_10750 [candidate division BRC1 bacterium SM23_51]
MAIRKLAFLCCCLAGLAHAEPLTLPLDQRPDWLGRDGIVMAGSWEPLLFRVRRDGSNGYKPSAEQRAAYEREQSPEMIAALKALGVNFVMAHCYKGAGLEAERESMADAVRFARLCHDAGLRVGVYNYSGAFLWEPLFEEIPRARDWILLDGNGKPRTYGRATYRYYWNRNHPDAQAYYRNIVRFAVNDIGADLIHFDNYARGPGREPDNVRRFRDYLRATFAPARLKEMGVDDLNAVEPAMTGPPDNLLRRAWLDFASKSLVDSYHEMGRYARSLRRDILLECNPGGVRDRTQPPVDHGRLLQGGEAFWDEGMPPGYRDGRLHSRIRTYKVARRMDNIAFAYATNRLEMAESMAFNRDCLGCICWFEYGKLVARPGSKEPVSKDLARFIRFFQARRELFRNTAVVADVAVLRSSASQVFADPKHARLTAAVEQTLIENRVPFQIIYDHHLNDLDRYRAVILAGCIALSDRQIGRIERYVQSGGRVCVIGPAATHDEWMIPRERPALRDIEPPNLIRISENEDFIEAIRRVCSDKLSLAVEGPKGLCAELTEQTGRRLVHLVNYRSDGPVENVVVSLRLPTRCRAESVTLVGPERSNDIALAHEGDGGLVRFTIPAINTYEIAVVTHEPIP